MAGVRQVLNNLKTTQEALTIELDQINEKIKEATTDNYKLEQEKLSLERQEILLKQKIASISLLEQEKLDKLNALAESIKSSESSEILSAKSQDSDERKDKLLEELKVIREKANTVDMSFEGLQKRLINVERNCDSTIQRAIAKEAEAKKLEDGFASATSKVQNLRSREDAENPDLVSKVEELQKKLREATTQFETAQRENSLHDTLLKNVTVSIEKQKNENDRIRKEMDQLNAECGA